MKFPARHTQGFTPALKQRSGSAKNIPLKQRNDRAGFTLVELAISIMIIGLLMGGVLKGQQLLQQARMTQYIRIFKEYDAAVKTFRMTYDSWPGDMRGGGTKLPDCSAAPCNVDGNEDGLIGSTGGGYYQGWTLPAIVSTGEPRRFWVHLFKAGVISSGIDPDLADTAWLNRPNVQVPSGPTEGSYITVNAYNSGTYGSAQTGNFYIVRPGTDSFVMSPRNARMLDQKMDDGRPGFGNVRANTNTWYPMNGQCASADGTFYSSQSDAQCNLRVLING